MAISLEFIELRKDRRIVMQQSIAFIYSGDSRDSAGNARVRNDGLLVDLGRNGAGLLVDQPLSPNQTLQLEGIDGLTGARAARVRWVRRTRALYRVGVEFVSGA